MDAAEPATQAQDTSASAGRTHAEPEDPASGKAEDRTEPETAGKVGDSTEAEAAVTAGDPTEAEATATNAGNTDDQAGTETKAAERPEDNTEGQPADKDKPENAAATPPTAAALAAASHGRATRVLRRANPVRVAKSTARSTSAWAKRPSGRLILPAVIAALLLCVAGTAGVYLVPKALRAAPSPSATPGFGVGAETSGGSGLPAGQAAPLPSLGGLPAVPGASGPPPGGTLPPTQAPVGGPVGGARPADVLASWAQQTGTRAGIPVVAVQAYGYAELVLGRTTPSCHLTWTTIAAVAKVESAHGSANGAVLGVDGSVAPPIFGLPLDGKGGRPEVRDTDQGALDGDAQFDRPIGPLQFLPQPWTAIAVGTSVDADNNGVSDPNDIDDASLAAAKQLCQGGRDLSRPDAWWDAILSYNALRPYAQKVFDAANEYGRRSRV